MTAVPNPKPDRDPSEQPPVPVIALATAGDQTQVHPPPEFKEVDLTPALAQQLLDNMQKNRPVKWAKVNAYYRDMVAGRFNGLNGETICIDWNNQMYQGQHRCLAVIKAQLTVRVVIGYGFDPESARTVDQGARRSIGDNLAMEGYKHSPILQSTTRLLIRYESGGRTKLDNISPGIAEVEALLAAHPEIVDSVEAIAPFTHNVSNRGAFGAAHYVLSRVDPVAAAEFFFKLESRTDLPAGSPILALDKRLVSVKKSDKVSLDEAFIMILKAWNLYRSGGSIDKLSKDRRGIVPIPR